MIFNYSPFYPSNQLLFQESVRAESDVAYYVAHTLSATNLPEYYTFSSACTNVPNANILGVLDNGKFTNPSKTPKSCDSAKLQVSFVTGTMVIVSY